MEKNALWNTEELTLWMILLSDNVASTTLKRLELQMPVF